jgi:hypothetical protein
MPYPNEIAVRIIQPLAGGIFARKNIAPGIDIILQKPKSNDTASMKVQAYRFDKEKFTPEEVKSWLKKHNISYISFEPASEPSKKEARQAMLNNFAHELTLSLIRNENIPK